MRENQGLEPWSWATRTCPMQWSRALWRELMSSFTQVASRVQVVRANYYSSNEWLEWFFSASCMKSMSHQKHLGNKIQYLSNLCTAYTAIWVRNLDLLTARLGAATGIPYALSATNLEHKVQNVTEFLPSFSCSRSKAAFMVFSRVTRMDKNAPAHHALKFFTAVWRGTCPDLRGQIYQADPETRGFTGLKQIWEFATQCLVHFQQMQTLCLTQWSSVDCECLMMIVIKCWWRFFCSEDMQKKHKIVKVLQCNILQKWKQHTFILVSRKKKGRQKTCTFHMESR